MHSVGNYLFSYSDILGHGAFALVYKGYKRGLKNELVAIKKIRKNSFSSLLSKERKEIAILSGLKHENIVSMLDFEETVSDIFLVLEFCNLGDLNDLLLKHSKISEDHIRYIFGQVGSAVSFLHSLQIIHRDLKPQNILLHSKCPCIEMSENSTTTTSMLKFTNMIAKIGDFGFARVLADTTMATTLCGSPLYMAPEILLGHSYDSKVDMWSIGTIIYQCFTGFAPFIAKTPQQLRKRYETDLKLQPKLPIQASPELNSLFLALLKRDSHVRLGSNEFSLHSFFQTVKLLSNVENNSPMRNMYYSGDNIKDYPNNNCLSSSGIGYSTSKPCVEANKQECKYMFASPCEKFETSTLGSIYPPHKFNVSPNLRNCLNKHKSVYYEENENISSMAGFVLLPNCLSDCKMQSIYRKNSSTPPNTLSSFEEKHNLSVVNDIPFFSLVPPNTQNDQTPKPFNSDTPIPHADLCKTSISFTPNEPDSNIFDISIINQSHPFVFNNDCNYNHREREGALELSNIPKNKRLSEEYICTCKDNVQYHSFPIPTMFFNTGSENNFKEFDCGNVPVELQPLDCPYEPSCSTLTDLELMPFGNFSVYSNSPGFKNYPFAQSEEYLRSTSNNLVEGEKVVLDGLDKIDPFLQLKYSSRLLISDVGNEYSMIEQFHRATLLCSYIFDTINLIRNPISFPNLQNSSFLFISNKSASCCDLKVLVLLVKVVRVISNIFDPQKYLIEYNNDSSSNEHSTFMQHKQALVELLIKTKFELNKLKFSFLASPTKSEFHHNCSHSAETLIYEHLVYICQIAALEQVFDKSNRNFVGKYMKANFLSKHLSQTSRDSSIFRMNQFGSYTKEAVSNI